MGWQVGQWVWQAIVGLLTTCTCEFLHCDRQLKQDRFMQHWHSRCTVCTCDSELEQLQTATTNNNGTAHRVQARTFECQTLWSGNIIPALWELLFLSNLVEFKACLDVTILDKAKQTPLAKAQKGACQLSKEMAVNVGEQKVSLTENMFIINCHCWGYCE